MTQRAVGLSPITRPSRAASKSAVPTRFAADLIIAYRKCTVENTFSIIAVPVDGREPATWTTGITDEQAGTDLQPAQAADGGARARDPRRHLRPGRRGRLRAGDRG